MEWVSYCWLHLNGEMSVTARNGTIVKETAEICKLPQKIKVCAPSVPALSGRWRKICTPGEAVEASYVIVIPFWRDSCEETGQRATRTQKCWCCSRFGHKIMGVSPQFWKLVTQKWNSVSEVPLALSMGGTCLTTQNGMIVEEIAKIYGLPQKFSVCTPSFLAFPGC